MSASTRKELSNCIILQNQLYLTWKQEERREYYEFLFKDVLEILKEFPNTALDITLIDSNGVFLVGAPAGLRRKLRKAYRENVTERIVTAGKTPLCKLLGFS